MKTNNSDTSVRAVTMPANAMLKSAVSCIYLGTQAKDEKRGIYSILFNLGTGELGVPIPVSDSIRPGFIAIHPDGKHLYATEAAGSFIGKLNGAVSAYRIEPNGMLTDLNTQPSGGLGPCHISISPDARYLLVANYHDGTCAVLPIRPDGTLGKSTTVQQHSGRGPHPTRQTRAHTHSINCSPDGRFALVADLGLDQIMIYRFENGSLILNNPPFVKTTPGSGPRHLTFDPAGKFVYACMELNGTVSVFDYDADHGILTEIQTHPTLPADFDGENTTSEVCITQDGRFLYVGNRGHDSLAIFKVNPETGQLTACGYESTRGQHPRNFTIDPSGQFLIAANMHSNNVVVFRINQKTGQLTFTGNEIMVPTATCIRFLTDR